MPLAKILLDALGLAENATDQDAVTAINTLKSDREVALNRASTPDLNKYVPKETYQVAVNRADTAEQSLKAIRDKEIDALVQGAIDEGKVAPANKEMYVGLCRSGDSGVEQFKAFIGTAPVIADAKTVTVPKTPSGSPLEEHELAMCRKMGVTEEEFRAAKANMNVGAK